MSRLPETVTFWIDAAAPRLAKKSSRPGPTVLSRITTLLVAQVGSAGSMSTVERRTSVMELPWISTLAPFTVQPWRPLRANCDRWTVTSLDCHPTYTKSP